MLSLTGAPAVVPNALGTGAPRPKKRRAGLRINNTSLFLRSPEASREVGPVHERWCSKDISPTPLILGLRDSSGTERFELDGFVLPAYRTGKSPPFAKSRIPVLKKLIELDRKARPQGIPQDPSETNFERQAVE